MGLNVRLGAEIELIVLILVGASHVDEAYQQLNHVRVKGIPDKNER